MKLLLQVGFVTALALLYYAYLGNYVPQKEAHPPEELQLTADMTADQLAEAGMQIYNGKGICNSCHTIGKADAAGLRFPDLGNIGAGAAGRKAGLSDIDYLAESMYDPNVFISEGFNPGMTPSNKAPINLTDEEAMAVIAYMQTLGGGAATVTLATSTKYYKGAAGATAAAPPAETPTDTSAPDTATKPASSGDVATNPLLDKYQCLTCHSTEKGKVVLGPSFYDTGTKLSEAELYESIMNPDKTLAKGFQAGVMKATLDSGDFYKKVTILELKEMVEFLASQKGGN